MALRRLSANARTWHLFDSIDGAGTASSNQDLANMHPANKRKREVVLKRKTPANQESLPMVPTGTSSRHITDRLGCDGIPGLIELACAQGCKNKSIFILLDHRYRPPDYTYGSFTSTVYPE